MISALRNMHLLYPSSPLTPKQPDEQFAAEVEAVVGEGFKFSLFSLEDFQAGTFRARPPLPDGTTVLYRGWMLTAAEYRSFASAILDAGARLMTDPETYLCCHYLPNWYPLLADLTPETRVYPADCDLEAELRALGWPGYFIKNYVKSLKTSVGSKITTPEQVAAVVADMRRYRGVIEGGFCVRRVEEFLADTEQRYFVMEGRPYAASGDVSQIVHECAKRIQSPLFSVDVVRHSDGQLRVVEIGDGQVSDLVGWTPDQFSSRLRECFDGKE
ncbi:MAG: ATP-grasp domain-containing protein [Verrucomicrobiota bacterium]